MTLCWRVATGTVAATAASLCQKTRGDGGRIVTVSTAISQIAKDHTNLSSNRGFYSQRRGGLTNQSHLNVRRMAPLLSAASTFWHVNERSVVHFLRSYNPVDCFAPHRGQHLIFQLNRFTRSAQPAHQSIHQSVFRSQTSDDVG